MNDQLIRDLLHEVADDVEPGDRLVEIRGATVPARARRGWWAVGGVGLLAASVVTAVALSTSGTPTSSGPGPVGSAPTTADDDLPDAMDRVVPVYFVGDTPAGPRLFRELRTGPGPMSAETFALDAAVQGDALDPDYRSPWPAGTSIQQYFFDDDVLRLSLTGDVGDRPAGMSASDARLSIEQLIRTAQGVFGEGRVPVKLLIDGHPTSEVLGVPASEPLGNAPDLAVLAPVSLSGPSEGQEVDNDEQYLDVRGRASSAGRLTIAIERVDGTGSLGDGTFTGLLRPDRLTDYEASFALSGAEPGDYDVVATARGADGAVHTDTRRITVVD